MVIECIGLPGSGKTYLLKGLERALRSRGAEVVNVTELTMNRLSWKVAARLMRAGVFTDKRSGAVENGSKRSCGGRDRSKAASASMKMLTIRSVAQLH